MKHFVSILTLFAILNLSFANFSLGGEVEKKPLKLEEMFVLAQEEVQDFEKTRDTEAGLNDGYGILALALIGVVTWVIVDQVNED
jgi:hypothetical protein